MHSRRAHIAGFDRRRSRKSSIFTLALPCALGKELLEHGRSAWFGLEEPANLAHALNRDRSQNQPSFFFRPSRRRAFFQPVLLAEFGWNDHLALGANYGAMDRHKGILL